MELYAVMMKDNDDICVLVGIFSDQSLADEVAASCQESIAWTEPVLLNTMRREVCYFFRTDKQQVAAHAAMLIRASHELETFRRIGKWGL